ncbi:MAG: hypothetical protein WCO86_05550, partial [Planctomycetota bacterium]
MFSPSLASLTIGDRNRILPAVMVIIIGVLLALLLNRTRLVRAPLGPVLEAGFWRSDVFTLEGTGLATACGDECADADTAITLARSGGRTVLEPHSRVVAAERRRPGGFRAGLTAERLFWRSLAGQSFIAAIVMHMLEVVRHAVARAPLGTLPMLLGRLVGFVQFGGYLPRFVQLRRLMARAAAARRPDASGNAATGNG